MTGGFVPAGSTLLPSHLSPSGTLTPPIPIIFGTAGGLPLDGQVMRRIVGTRPLAARRLKLTGENMIWVHTGSKRPIPDGAMGYMGQLHLSLLFGTLGRQESK